MARILFKNAALVATQDEAVGDVENADVLVDGQAISAVGQNLSSESQAGQPPAEVIDASGRVIVPGFINTHHHLYQVLTRCLPAVQDAKLFDWLTYLYDVWKHITPEDVYCAARAGLAELALTGCTTVADHHYVCPESVSGDFFEAEAKAAEELGVRISMTRGSMSLGQSAGGLPPDCVVQDEDTILADSERVVDKFHNPGRFSMCQVSLAPCSPFSVTTELMTAVAELARKKKVRLHTHLAETLDEEKFCIERSGRRPLQLMEDLGWLGDDVWFAHCVFLNDEEIEKMAATQTGVAHCPVSNLRLGSGIARIPAMLAADVPVGLAVDGSASNDSSNMLRELMTAMLVHRVGTAVDAMPASKVLSMATVGGARVLGRDDLGQLKPGMAADLAMFDLRGLAYAGARHDPVAALLFCGMDQRAELVMADGKIIVRDRQLVGLDEQVIGDAASSASQGLLKKAKI